MVARTHRRLSGLSQLRWASDVVCESRHAPGQINCNREQACIALAEVVSGRAACLIGWASRTEIADTGSELADDGRLAWLAWGEALFRLLFVQGVAFCWCRRLRVQSVEVATRGADGGEQVAQIVKVAGHQMYHLALTFDDALDEQQASMQYECAEAFLH